MLHSLTKVSLYLKSLTKTAMENRTTAFSHLQQINQDAISYHFHLALHPGKNYEGVSQIKFNVVNDSFESNSMFLDFQGKNVQEIVVNSEVQNVQLYDEKQGKIMIPKNAVKKGENNVCVKYENQYDNDGSGCVSFTDVDGKQYLYTQFEPYMGSRVFPLFDQPNLKAKMNLSIHCPQKWETVLSNENEIKVEERNIVCQKTKQILNNFIRLIPKTYKRTDFSQTKLLPTYLYCFVVGPYKKYPCLNTYKNIPMNLYCIQSLDKYMKQLIPYIEEMTNTSMEFFQQYFGHPYPFSKYDQVFAHEYKWGAMENAGIVTFNDLYIFKDKVSSERMLSFGNTIVHQLAHHWFGNLVTMRWWDDLWLNESFAEYISHFCLQKIKGRIKTLEYESAMVSFFNRKGWGYNEDQLSTTHPIRSSVENTQVAESIFDGITYSKGAATMKQLMYLMGEENFSKALSHYFHKFAFKNAQLDDLLNSLNLYYKSNATGISLQEWKKMWLETPSLNELECSVQKDELVIKQTPYSSNHPYYRTHMIKIGFVQESVSSGEKKVEVKEKEVIVEDKPETRVKVSQDLLQSKAIVLNHDDLSFVKTIIDEKSLKYLEGNLSQINDILFRSLVWKTYFDMVKEAKTKSVSYIKTLVNNLHQEQSDTILEEQLNYALLAIFKFTPKQQREPLLVQMYDFCHWYLTSLKYSENREVILKEKIISFSQTQKQIHQILNWFNYNEKSSLYTGGLSLNITLRWRIVLRVLGSDHVSKNIKKQLLAKQIEADKSDTMINRKHTCDSLLLQPEQLQERYNSYLKDGQKWSMTSLTHSMMGFNHQIHAEKWRKTFVQKYYRDIKNCLQKRDRYEQKKVLLKNQMLELFVDGMDPVVQDNVEDLSVKVEKLKKISPTENDKMRINIEKKISSLNKRLKCYQLF